MISAETCPGARLFPFYRTVLPTPRIDWRDNLGGGQSMKKRVIAWILLACLPLLTACGQKEEAPRGVLETAADLDGETILLTIGEREVPAWRYLYWLGVTCDRVGDFYAESGGAPDWNAPVSGGTLADYARDQALADTALYATVENWAEEYQCALTDEDRAALAENWAAKAEESGGEDAYLAKLKPLGLDRDRAQVLAEDGRLYGKLFALYRTQGSALNPAKGVVTEFSKSQGYATVERIFLSAGDDKTAQRKKAETLFAQLNASGDPLTAFAAMAETYSKDPTLKRTFVPGESGLDPSLESAALNLAENQWSGILETADGFSILLRRSVDMAAVAADYFDFLLQSSAEDAAVETTRAYDHLEISGFYQELTKARNDTVGD